jgi:hypothetical protein
MRAAGKDLVAEQYLSGALIQFAIVKFEAGHNCTQYSRWLEADDFYSIPYTNVSSCAIDGCNKMSVCPLCR